MSASTLALKFQPDHGAGLASQPASTKTANFQISVPDWTRFRSGDTLAQKAGVPKYRLRRIALKELVDNALDTGSSNVNVQALDRDSYLVTDDGPGIQGGAERVAHLFSINRPLVSSKLWRIPSRGAMGNGLRVVVGTVAASGGALKVTTGGRRYTLQPAEDGSTTVVADEPSERLVGTAVEITFGPDLPSSGDDTAWADAAIWMSLGTVYGGKPSPWWYDGDVFFELLQGAGERPVREFVERLDGCSGGKAGRITSDFKGRVCRSMSREDATGLLRAARRLARPVKAERLGEVGRPVLLPEAYAIKRGLVRIGGREPKAELPIVVEAWGEAEPRGTEGDEVRIQMFVNRTPAVAEIAAWRSGGKLRIMGCGLNHQFEVGAGRYEIIISLTTPWCPVTTDGKEPDLSPFVSELAAAIQTAARKAKSALSSSTSRSTRTHKDVVLERLAEAVDKASSGGRYRFNQRQLFYVVRSLVQGQLARELRWDNFCKIVTDHEAERGDIAGMFRDPRGTLYHPHLGRDIALGTLAVEQYARPAWTFGQVLYLEKEGFFEALKAARWPERHDCALLTSKGFSSRAVRDLIDLLGTGEEPVRVFCVHDADASGTMIYQTLQEETKARARRTVEIVNLGLEPWEAIEMRLAAEEVEEKGRRQPVAEYVLGRADGEHWADWLQSARVELNEMTTGQFISWLDEKIAAHGAGKVLPPVEVAVHHLQAQLHEEVRTAETAAILAEAGLDRRVAERVAAIALPSPRDLLDAIEAGLDEETEEHWRGVVDETAVRLAKGAAA